MLALDFEGKSVRTVGAFVTRTGVEAEMGWVLADVCACLQLVKPGRAADGLEEDEKGAHIVSTPGGDQELLVISEPGLYRLLSRSRKPEAKRFTHWVFHEVLPTIRKTGGYGITQQHGSDLATLVGDAVSSAIRPILEPVIIRQEMQAEQLDFLAGEIVELKSAKDAPLQSIIQEYGLMPLGSWLAVNTVNKAPALPGLYRFVSQAGRTLYIGKADGVRGLLGRIDANKHEAMKFLWHQKASYTVHVCPTEYGGATLARAEEQLTAKLRPDWVYGGLQERWAKIKGAMASDHQPMLF